MLLGASRNRRKLSVSLFAAPVFPSNIGSFRRRGSSSTHALPVSGCIFLTKRSLHRIYTIFRQLYSVLSLTKWGLWSCRASPHTRITKASGMWPTLPAVDITRRKLQVTRKRTEASVRCYQRRTREMEHVLDIGACHSPLEVVGRRTRLELELSVCSFRSINSNSGGNRERSNC